MGLGAQPFSEVGTYEEEGSCCTETLDITPPVVYRSNRLLNSPVELVVASKNTSSLVFDEKDNESRRKIPDLPQLLIEVCLLDSNSSQEQQPRHWRRVAAGINDDDTEYDADEHQFPVPANISESFEHDEMSKVGFEDHLGRSSRSGMGNSG